MAEPFLKWVGGKRQLVPELLKHVPDTCARYYEPFVGGGALFFELRERKAFKHACLNDANLDLIHTYQQVRNHVEDVIDILDGLDCGQKINGLKEEYLKVRELFNHRSPINNPARRAAWFIAMNAWGFNGLCRYNQKGGFNVPCGKFSKTPVLLSKADNLRAASIALKSAVIASTDFGASIHSAVKGDLIYFDPPYIPVNATSNFTGYTGVGFDMSHQHRLMAFAVALVDRGVHVILSNSDTPATRKLYKDKGFTLHEVQARRAVNSNASKRGKVGELIIVGRP